MASGKKKPPILFFVSVFIAVVLFMLLVNSRSGLEYEIRFPLNNGVAYLKTNGSYLAATCHDNKVYLWDWRDLKAEPKIVEVQSDQASLLKSGP